MISGSPLLFLDARRRKLQPDIDDSTKKKSSDSCDEKEQDSTLSRGKQSFFSKSIAAVLPLDGPQHPHSLGGMTESESRAGETYIPEDRSTLIHHAMRCYEGIAEEYMNLDEPKPYCVYDIMDLAWFREVLKGHGDADPDDDEDVYGFHIPHKGQKKKTHVKHKRKSKFHGEELKNAIVNGVFDSNPFGRDHEEHKTYK